MGEIEEKRNAPHILKVNNIADQILAVNSLLVFGEKADANDFGKTAEAAGLILRDIRAAYSNREMALVCTKLEEAIDWCAEKNTTQAKYKLTEAINWCKRYTLVLSD